MPAVCLFDTTAEGVRTMQIKQRSQFTPGWYRNLSNDDYHHSTEQYSSSNLKILAEQTFTHMEHDRSLPEESTPAMLSGNVLHAMLLEPSTVPKRYAVKPADVSKPSDRELNARTIKAATRKKIARWEEWQREKGPREELTQEQYRVCYTMAQKVLTHPEAGELFKRSDRMVEQSFFLSDRKARTDLVVPGNGIVFDLKSTRCASQKFFRREIYKLGYHFSAAMYLDVVNEFPDFLDAMLVHHIDRFVWIVVENEPPFEVAVYRATEKQLADGRKLYDQALQKLEQYKQSRWKGYGEWNETEVRPWILDTEKNLHQTTY